ncbi:MAG: mevalonate 3,5-bisphosphate decarboxylase [Thermoplasmataceae archaeon]
MAEFREMGEEIRKKLIDGGIMTMPEDHAVNLEEGKISYGFGYPITGLEKFLGYFDKQFNIAYFPSISYLTDFSITYSACMYSRETGSDTVVLDGRSDDLYNRRSLKAINYLKDLYGLKGSMHFYLKRERRYRNAKGLGESASVAAAASRSVISNIFGNDGIEDSAFVSRFARLVSGSGTRSVAGSVSMWLSYPWIRESESYAFPIGLDTKNMYFSAYTFPADFPTENAHEIAISSPGYNGWAKEKFQRMLEYLDSGFSLADLMGRSQKDMYAMHSLLMYSGNMVLNSDSLALIEKLKRFRQKNNGNIVYTADTGPSISIISDDQELLSEFTEENPGSLSGQIPDQTGVRIPESFRRESEEYFSGLTGNE